MTMTMIAVAHAQEAPLWSVSPVVGGELIVFPLLRAIHIFTLGRPNPIVGGQTLQHPISTFLSIVFPLSGQLYFPFSQMHFGQVGWNPTVDQSQLSFDERVCQRPVFAEDRVPSRYLWQALSSQPPPPGLLSFLRLHCSCYLSRIVPLSREVVTPHQRDH